MVLNQYFSYNNVKCKYNHLLNAKTINYVKDNDFNDTIWIWPLIYQKLLAFSEEKHLEKHLIILQDSKTVKNARKGKVE